MLGWHLILAMLGVKMQSQATSAKYFNAKATKHMHCMQFVAHCVTTSGCFVTKVF